MIYHEVALEPTVVRDIKDLGLIMRTFGFEYGRLIALFPAKPKGNCWKKQFYEHLKKILPFEEHKRLELQYLSLTEGAIFRSRNQSFIPQNLTWRQAAITENANRSFSAILCDEAEEKGETLPFQQLHWPDGRFPHFFHESKHFGECLKDPLTFFDNLRPLIMSAKRIQLIDPYLNPAHDDNATSKRWQKSIEKLANYLRSANRLTIDIEMHTKSDGVKDADQFVSKIAESIAEYFPPTTTLCICSWADKHQGISFHARYLLTDKAGVALDYGLDLKASRRTDVTLLGKNDALRRSREFDPENPTIFDLDGCTKITGRRNS